MFHPIEDAIKDLQAGKMVIVCDDEDRENEGDLLAIAEYVTPETINFMTKVGRGLVCMPVMESLAQKLELAPMTMHNTDKLATAFTVSVDHKETSTGISAFERAFTIQKMLNKSAVSDDFARPGHIFPLIAKNDGVFERNGHTEAAVDFARLAGAQPAGVICEIMNDDGSMARVPDLEKIAESYDLKMVTIKQLIDYRLKQESEVKREADIQLPTKFGSFRTIVYTDKRDGKESIACIKGNPSQESSVLLRIHSECLTGDVFGSHRCDCGPQLHTALERMEQEGSGILLYMRQEGRGIGLVNKLKAYELQEQGFDTVEANEALGFEADCRDYYVAAQMIKDLGVKNIRLMTNNPQKINDLQKHGITIDERVPLHVSETKENIAYLQTKQEKMGHLLNITGVEQA